MAGSVVTVTQDTFEEEVLASDRPVVVDFWAPWCGPCRMLAPIFEQLAARHGERVKFAKLNVDENQALAAQYRVMSIPTLIVFKDGQPVEQIVGLRPEPELERLILGAAGATA